jgi:hypothetical protein
MGTRRECDGARIEVPGVEDRTAIYARRVVRKRVGCPGATASAVRPLRVGAPSMRRAGFAVAACSAFGIPLGQQLSGELSVGRIDVTHQPLAQKAHGDHHRRPA